MLPEQTFIYGRIENAEELRTELAKSSLGQMMADPKLRPFAGDLFATAGQLFDQLNGQLDVSLEELLAIPQGQLAVGLVAIETPPQPGEAQPRTKTAGGTERDESPEAIRRRIDEKQAPQDLGWLIVIDTGKENGALVKLLADVEQKLIRGGTVARTQTVGETTVRRLMRPDGSGSEMEYFHRDGATVIGIGPNVATDALARWDGKAAGRTLAESPDFAAVMGRCIGAADTRPQVTFFADPYRLARWVARQGGVGAALAWTVFEELGASKVRGVGASIFQGGEVFADIAHAHILIDPPRDGIFSVLRPADGDTTPPDWVPDDVTSYTSIGWRAEATYDGLGRILDRFQGEGALDRLIEEPYKQRVGGDFRSAIIEALDDRLVRIHWLQPPVKFNSSVSINALQLKDASAASRTLEELREAFPNAVGTDSIGATKLYLLGRRQRRVLPDGMRQPEPCAAIVGDWLLTSDSREFIERAIRAQGGAIPRLVELPVYDLLASELGGQLGRDKPFLLSFSRSAEIFRQLYELAKSDQTKALLQTLGEEDEAYRRVGDVLQRNELPPFEEFKKYFAPSGAFAYDEPNGIHFGRYTLRPE